MRRFEKGELRDKSEDGQEKPWRLSRDDSSSLAKSLRNILLRSARSYPAYAIDLFKRTIVDEDRRQAVYADLMAFSPVMVSVNPEIVADLAEAHLLDELPEDELNRKAREREDYFNHLKTLRAIPKEKLTENQKRALSSPSLSYAIGNDRYDFDDIGIQRHDSFYFPTSALHEPFRSLFAAKPEIALRLVRNLANHATKGWKQIHAINRRKSGTPIAVAIEFPWGGQEFWGDWHVYNWGMGQLAPNPLECAFLALNYWAFKQLDAGRTASEVIKDIVTGNECYAVLGIALMLALETWETTETTLAVATCQRLWPHDLARHVQEPNKDIDLFGMGFMTRLKGEQARAKEYLDARKSRGREVRALAMFFALNPDHALSEKFKAALAGFPDELPYELEEQKNETVTAQLKEDAERWAGLGDRKNYKQSQYNETHVSISYESPKPLTENEEERLKESATSIKGFNIVGWAMQSIKANAVAAGLSLGDALAHAKSIDTVDAFDTFDRGASSPQAVIASVAACVIRLSDPNSADLPWVWDVMARTEAMKEPDDVFGGAKIAWHPKTRLVMALHHDRRSTQARPDSSARLIKLALHPLDNVSEFAFDVLFADHDETVRWIAGQLAVNLCTAHRGEFTDAGWDREPGRKARAESLAAALGALERNEIGTMPALPPAWVKGVSRRRRMQDEEWNHPNVYFDAQSASRLFGKMPVEAWMGSAVCRPLFEPLLFGLSNWTAESIMPPWQSEDDRRRDNRHTELLEWNRTFADMMARAVTFVSVTVARDRFVKPFLPDDEDALCVLAAFADKTVLRHIFDAKVIPKNALPLLDDLVTRVVQDRTFKPNGWRAGQVNGYDMPDLIKALLFVNFDGHAPGSSRFGNGDWSQIDKIMPIVDRMVRSVGWSAFVMSRFLTLCVSFGLQY